jgi:hypothetical protein
VRVLFALVLAAVQVCAQEYAASITISVVDPSLSLVPGAKVVLRSLQRQAVFQANTDARGMASFTPLDPGDYALEVTKDGFETVRVERLSLAVRDRQNFNLKLKVAQSATSVTVTAAAEGVNTDPSSGVSMDHRYFQNLPVNGRNAESLIMLAAGITTASGERGGIGRGFNANGLRSNTNYYTLDGVSLSSPVGGAGMFRGGGPGAGPPAGMGSDGASTALISLDSMQEMRVQTSPFAPEFGRSPGAQVSMTSRGGSNDLHGSLFYYLRNERLDANDWFANSRGHNRGTLRQNRPGGTLGGPIRKDHTFFFASYEGLRLVTPSVVITSVPDLQSRRSAPATMRPYLSAFPIPNGAAQDNGAAEFHAVLANPSESDAASVRLDHVTASKGTVFARYNLTPANGLSRGGLISSSNLLTQQDSRSHAATLGWTVATASGILNDLRLSYSRSSSRSFSIMDDFGGAVPFTDSQVFPTGVTSANGQFSLSMLSVGSYSLGGTSRNDQEQVNLVYSLSRTIESHSYKLGLDFRRIMPANYRNAYTANVTFNGLGGSVGALASGIATNAQISSNLAAVYPVYSNFSAYAQDTWRADERTTITYGLRWDVNPAPGVREGPRPLALATSTIAGVTQNEPLYETRWLDVAPRFGLAYQMDATPGRELVFRTGVGLFYDIGYGVSAGAFGGAPYSNVRTISLAVFTFAPADANPPAMPPQRPYGQITAAERTLKSPIVAQWNVAVDRSFGFGQSLSVAYVGTKGRRLMRTESQPSFGDAYSILNLATNGAASDYNGLQVQFRRRLADNLQTQVSYTWAHSIDSASGDISFGAGFASLFGEGQRGSSDYDIRQNLSWSGSFRLLAPGSSLLRRMWGNWHADWLASARTSLPFDVQGITTETSDSESSSTTTVNRRGGLFAQVRPNYTGQPVWISDSNAPGGRRLNPAAFEAPDDYAQGNLGRNSLRGFGFKQLDFALRRQIALSEKWGINVSAQAFNLLNNASFANPTALGAANLSSPTFGVATRTLGGQFGGPGGAGSLYRSGGPRSIELAIRLQF